MSRLLPLFFLLSLFTACSGAEKEVEDTFTTIINLHTSDNRSNIEDYFDDATHQYIAHLIDHARDGDEIDADDLGLRNELPISTMTLYYSLAETEAQPDTSGSVVFSEEFVWLYFLISGSGVFRHTKEYPIKIRDGATLLSDTRAELSVAIPTGNNALLGTTYIFNKEDNKWKLNLLSTMKIMEKIHTQNQRRSGLGVNEYAKQTSRSGSDELQFQYRKYQ